MPPMERKSKSLLIMVYYKLEHAMHLNHLDSEKKMLLRPKRIIIYSRFALSKKRNDH